MKTAEKIWKAKLRNKQANQNGSQGVKTKTRATHRK